MNLLVTFMNSIWKAVPVVVKRVNCFWLGCSPHIPLVDLIDHACMFSIGQVKTEGGHKVKAQKTGIYKKWKASTHNKIASKGSHNEGNVGATVGFAGIVQTSEACRHVGKNSKVDIWKIYVETNLTRFHMIIFVLRYKSQKIVKSTYINMSKIKMDHLIKRRR